MKQSFRKWLHESVLNELYNGLDQATGYLFAEVEDYSKQGYRRITAKFDNPRLGIKVGDPVWWKQGAPVIPVQGQGQGQGQTPAPVTPQQSQKNPYIAPQAKQAQPWYCGTAVEGNPLQIPPGIKLIARQEATGTWEVWDEHFRGKENIPATEIKNTIQSIRDPNGKPITTNNPKNYLQPKGPKKQSTTIPDEMISEEQKAIDAKFEKMISGKGQSHMMINALAGTGKTTMLKHLAWKYGKPGQKWLYLVFNTKNKVEAKDAFPTAFVEVKTTNGFLGEVLKSDKNLGTFPQTERIAGLEGMGEEDDDSKKKLQKSRILAEGPGFNQLVTKLTMPNGEVDANTLGLGRVATTINKLLKSIRYQFKEQVLKLMGLAKSFALDPRNQGDLVAGLQLIMEDYEFDTGLGDIKERINKYSGIFKTNVTYGLQQALGYDFMGKDYAEEIIQATAWIMNESRPHQSQQKYRHGKMDYNLGELRDFDDDLWYAAAHANEIHWPRYDVVLADEVQDFNEAQKVMLQKLTEAGAKVVAVGDPNQAIYRFRGADADAFGGIGKMLHDKSQDKNVQHGLTKNFRSRNAILDFANEVTHVKDLKSGRVYKDGYGGEISYREQQYDDAFSKLQKEKNKFGYMKQTAFIARTNEPLVHAALKCLGDNIPFVIVGKDIAKDLRNHINKVMARFGVNDNDPSDVLSEKMEELRNSEVEAYGEQDVTKKAYLQELNEVTDALLSAMEQFKNESGGTASPDPYAYTESPPISTFKKWIYQRLGGLDVTENEKDLAKYRQKMENENPVVLTTSHKSKGLEFERVNILRDDLFPHPKSKRPKDLAQEANSKYVAYTRAMSELHVIDLEGQPGYKPPRSAI